MVTVDEAVTAELEKGGQKFEVLVDCEEAMKFRKGESDKKIRDILAVEDVFKDASKGKSAPNLEKVFGTSNVLEVARQVVENGDIQLTSEYKNKLAEKKKEKIIGNIARNAINAQKKTPIPRERIENAVEKVDVNIDPFEEVSEQVDEVVEALRPIIPISFEKKKYKVLVPAKDAASTYGVLKKVSDVESEEWLSDGSLKAEVSVTAGDVDKFYDKVNKKTDGDVNIKEN